MTQPKPCYSRFQASNSLKQRRLWAPRNFPTLAVDVDEAGLGQEKLWRINNWVEVCVENFNTPSGIYFLWTTSQLRLIWIMSLNWSNIFISSKKKNASGYKSLKLSVTAQRKEKKEAAKTNEEYPFLPVTSSHISCKMYVLFTNIQNPTVIFQNIC